MTEVFVQTEGKISFVQTDQARLIIIIIIIRNIH